MSRVAGLISLFLGGTLVYKAISEASGPASGETDPKKFAIQMIFGIPLIYLGFKLLL